MKLFVVCTQWNHLVQAILKITLNIPLFILNYPLLFFDLEPWLTRSSSNYSELEHLSIVPKLFELLKFTDKSVSSEDIKNY